MGKLDKRDDSMHIGGSITDELRAWWVRKFPVMDKKLHKNFTAIADRIDAEHEAQLNDAFETRNSDENLESDGWVRLPLDADGVPIRVGDVMEWPTTYETFEVVGIGDGTLFYIEDGSEQADWTGASTKRHHHAQTVEDVLREFGKAWVEWEDGSPYDPIAKYAVKLRLAGGDAE